MFRLDNRIAIITGAGSGIGREIALLYARQGATAVVADIDRAAAEQVAGEITAAGGVAGTLALDVADESAVEAGFAELTGRYGRLDICVNNAGVGHVGNVLETEAADWDRLMAINARGVFLCSRAAVAQMLRQEPAGGVLVNIASVAGLIAVERRLAYCASKGAVVALTRSIAIDFAAQHIRANAICPGTVHTPFVEGYLERSFADRKDEVRAQLHARQPVGRMGRPDEIAAAALYLASDEAEFVTGSAFAIDGGWTAR